MQQPEEITIQNFSLNARSVKQFLAYWLSVFLSENLQENEQNLDKIITTLFSIQSTDLRISFAALINTIKHFPVIYIEPQLKLNLLKTIAQFTAKDVKLLCETFLKFHKCTQEISRDNNKITPVVLLFALQFPADYKNVLIAIQGLIENLDLLDKNIILFKELHKLSDPMIANHIYLK